MQYNTHLQYNLFTLFLYHVVNVRGEISATPDTPKYVMPSQTGDFQYNHDPLMEFILVTFPQTSHYFVEDHPINLNLYSVVVTASPKPTNSHSLAEVQRSLVKFVTVHRHS